MTTETPAAHHTVAILTPTGKDARITERVLRDAGFNPVVCADVPEVCEALGSDVGALLIGEEALPPARLESLIAALDAQPSWSDVPLIVITGEDQLSRNFSTTLGALVERGNLTLLERPVRVATLVTTLRSALRARERQFDMRDYLEERLAAVEALRESESRLRAAVLAAPYPMMLHADDGEILQLNEAWSSLSGYDADDLCTTSDWKAQAFGRQGAKTDSPIEAELEKYDSNGGDWLSGGERTITTSDGTRRIWDFHTVALGRLPDKRRISLTAALDVTPFKELIERERAARQDAENANKAKSVFLTTMSHELRTPLNAIAGYTQLLSMGISGPVTENQQAHLTRIAKSQRHLLALINDVLNFAKIEAGHIAFDFGHVDMGALLLDLETFVRPQMDSKQITYTADCTPGLIADADEEKVKQILLNLLSNAIKFTPEKGHIVLECTSDGREIRTSVGDDGQGIAAGELEAIFEPFVQVGRGFNSPSEGTGLGLSISRDLARRMRGDLTVESQLGTGSTFTLTLPLSSAANVSDA